MVLWTPRRVPRRIFSTHAPFLWHSTVRTTNAEEHKKIQVRGFNMGPSVGHRNQHNNSTHPLVTSNKSKTVKIPTVKGGKDITYLFSWVTLISFPFSFKSNVWFSPNNDSITLKQQTKCIYVWLFNQEFLPPVSAGECSIFITPNPASI